MKKIYKQITKKQAGVIFRAYKDGKINISEEDIKRVYNLVDYNGYDDNGTMQWMNDRLQIAIEKIFAGEYGEADEQIKLALK